MTQDSVPPLWKTDISVGFDFSQLFQLNPRQGAGQNRLGLGGAINATNSFNSKGFTWDNTLISQFSVQRFGSGIISNANRKRIPFQKAIDEMRYNSKVGWKTSPNSPLYFAFNLGILTQLSPTYKGTATFPGNFLSNISETPQNPLSKFFSPASVTLSAGVDYKSDGFLSVFYSPFTAKGIIVLDDSIAATGIHGNVGLQIGSLIRTQYTKKFFEEKILVNSTIVLFSNYLNNPFNIDLDWTNEISLSIINGLKVSMLVNAFYDDDILVQITDRNAPNGISGLGKRLSLTQQLLFKYNIIF
jgi:hypothetical protein